MASPSNLKSIFKYQSGCQKKLLEGKEISLVAGFSQGIVVARRNLGVTTCSALKVHRNAMASHTVLTDRTRSAADV